LRTSVKIVPSALNIVRVSSLLRYHFTECNGINLVTGPEGKCVTFSFLFQDSKVENGTDISPIGEKKNL